MEKIKVIKLTAVGTVALLTARLGNLATPLYSLVLLLVLDYITALRAAKYRGETLDSTKGIQGIEKKVFMLLLVGIGYLADVFIGEVVGSIGVVIVLKTPIAITVALWLGINELISILENIKDIVGDKAPAWLLALLKGVKNKLDDEAPKHPPGEE